MKRELWHRAILLFFGLTALTTACCGGFYAIVAPAERIADSENPPTTVQESDLAGTWETHYTLPYSAVDKLILRPDGTFKQIYKNLEENYVYETAWNEWSIERFSDGRVRVHLEEARYYPDGIRIAEKNGIISTPLVGTRGKPRAFTDPFDPEHRYRSVYMIGELVLNVRVLPSGELVLVHMWTSSEDAFSDAYVFHRLETSSPSQTPTP